MHTHNYYPGSARIGCASLYRVAVAYIYIYRERDIYILSCVPYVAHPCATHSNWECTGHSQSTRALSASSVAGGFRLKGQRRRPRRVQAMGYSANQLRQRAAEALCNPTDRTVENASHTGTPKGGMQRIIPLYIYTYREMISCATDQCAPVRDCVSNV